MTTSACPACGQHVAEPSTLARMWAFEVDREVSSANARIINGKHGYRYSTPRKYWERVFLAKVQQLHIAPAEKHRHVMLTRVFGKGQHAMDYDNLVGGAKMIVDAMKTAKMIKNDSPGYVTVRYEQERAKDGVARTRFVVGEVGA